MTRIDLTCSGITADEGDQIAQTALNEALVGQYFVDAYAVRDACGDSDYRFPVVLRFEEFDVSLDVDCDTSEFRASIHKGDALQQMQHLFELYGPQKKSCYYWARIEELKGYCGEVTVAANLIDTLFKKQLSLSSESCSWNVCACIRTLIKAENPQLPNPQLFEAADNKARQTLWRQ
ncbi:hypothetical protein [uncultured Slackia sp.]|uniref:hypothetical protein n=1 Tax=uncultured Slackia sp. TaxID=665903 RepID=UPI0026202852|nr:hypothetical protein [uncultured Slackia sp.]